MVRDTWIATVFGFCYLFVWGGILDLSMVEWYRVASATRAPCGQSPLATLYLARSPASFFFLFFVRLLFLPPPPRPSRYSSLHPLRPAFRIAPCAFALHIPRRSVPPIRCVAILRQTLSMTGNDFCVVKFSLSRGCIATHRRHSCRLPAPRAASSRGPRTRLPWRLAEPPKIRVSGPGGPLRRRC